ncbi:MAG: hypothetical protein JRF62_13690 [Deltaproteobacteria bacterium]|nr:hypothetical protein [Deltaproteobacteria bacterium]MBW2640936.1 hypothetical protein [Deltaproteobacteria bacterium]MBW2681079.1 hypothetical protein [Deltaproteobacteria bacterium]
MIPKIFVNCKNFNNTCTKMKDIRSTIKEVLDLLAQKNGPSLDETLYALKQKDYHNALEKYCEDCDNFSPVAEWG